MVRTHTCIFLVLAVVLTSLFPLALAVLSGKIGVDYGLNGDNLPTPAQTVALLQSKRIRRVRLYEARLDVTRAFAKSGIDLLLGVPNEEVPKLAASLTEALKWVTKYVVPFPTSRISALIVGNEWLFNCSNNPALLVPAMENIHSALSTLKVSYKHLGRIKVSTAHAFNVLSTPSFPPSIATFAKQFVPVMRPLIGFLEDTGSFFMINIAPFFAYVGDKSISLKFALFESTQIVTDPNTKLNYTNLFDLQLDAVYAAIKSLSLSRTSLVIPLSYYGMELQTTSKPQVVAGEVPWPSGTGSAGTPPTMTSPLPSSHTTLWATQSSSSSTTSCSTQPSRLDTARVNTAATVDNARTFNQNLIRHVLTAKGTPANPTTPIQAYIFEIFNENLKPPGIEQNFGLFYANGTAKYPINFHDRGK